MDGDSSWAQVVTHTSYSSGHCSTLSPLSMATSRGFSLPIIVTKHTHHCDGTLERSGCLGDAVAAAESGSGRGTPAPGAPPATWLLCGRVQGARRPAPGDALLDPAWEESCF